jgi:hypothetical protein
MVSASEPSVTNVIKPIDNFVKTKEYLDGNGMLPYWFENKQRFLRHIDFLTSF